MTKLVILDFDGVVTNFWPDRHEGWKVFSPDYVAGLKEITEETRAKIVVCSSWRHVLLHDDCSDTIEFFKHWLDFVGITPDYRPSVNNNIFFLRDEWQNTAHHCDTFEQHRTQRWHEVLDFKDLYESIKKTKVDAWCVLDDEPDMYKQEWKLIPEFEWKIVSPPEDWWIEKKHVMQAIDILTK